MAINTKEKRVSVLGVARPWMRDKLPSSLLGEGWRRASGNIYSGNTLNIPNVDGLLYRASLGGRLNKRASLTSQLERKAALNNGELSFRGQLSA